LGTGSLSIVELSLTTDQFQVNFDLKFCNGKNFESGCFGLVQNNRGYSARY
jgi:hypothetical protein